MGRGGREKRLTGLPVMESPSAMIRTWPDDCAELMGAMASMRPRKAKRKRKVAMVVPGHKSKSLMSPNCTDGGKRMLERHTLVITIQYL